MGNTASCTPYSSSRTIKVIDSDGGVEEYTRSVRVAELMLENPGKFVCDSANLKVGSRIPGLAADEELEPHRLYFLLPMDMLYSVLTEEEMVSLTCNASSGVKKGGSRNIGRILPVLSDFCLFPAEAKKVAMPSSNAKPAQMMSRQRSWIPALDTIEEAPCMN